MIRKQIFIIAILFSFSFSCGQQYGGMWIPTEINEKEMKEMGMKISAKDIFNTSKPSIKDAVVQFNGGCTAEIISPKGLLLTNHHCGYRNIQSHSSVENNLIADGFWAKNMAEELPNPGVTVDFIVDIKDISDQILSGTENLIGTELEAKVNANTELYKSSQKIEDYQKIVVKSMYYGNKYYAYVIDTYKDIRLVGAPPSSIGNFGSDTDNWVFPRHTGDFSIFRIYADKNNKPAEYSKDNVPYVPKYFLPISIKDKDEGDFTFVFGFPGKTQEYLPAIAVEKIINDIDPAMISVRDITLKTLDEKMRSDPAIKIKYAAKYASIANYWKKWRGELEGLKKSNAVEKKRQYEQMLIAKNRAVKSILEKLDTLYNSQIPFALNRAYYLEVVRNAETLKFANYFIDLLEMKEAGRLDTKTQQYYLDLLSRSYKDYNAILDAKVMAKVLALYQHKNNPTLLPAGFNQFSDAKKNEEIFEEWSKNSIISGRGKLNGKTTYTDLDGILNDLNFVTEIKKDPFYKLALNLRSSYSTNTEKNFTKYQQQIDALQKKYMAKMLETDKDRKFFPDANSTLRITYGKVAGSNPKDALYYGYQTYLSGVMEKYIPGDYEFDVPQRLIQLYNSKDYGIYKDKSGDVPVNFTATNHTTGGNSGSPALDAYGNLVGLNFDRQWEGTMSDINYDPKLSRNIMVDTKYILFIIDKYANAKWLLDEMKIVK